MKKAIASFVVLFVIVAISMTYCMSVLLAHGPELVGAVAAQVHNAYVQGAK